jgi:nucleoside-diphosphate-sugar epimerase
MKILVVGGAGYVGGAVTDQLLAHPQNRVRVYDCLLYEETYRKPVEFVFGDVRDRNRLMPELAWADAVVWLAAIVGDGACAAHPGATREVNLEAVRWMSSTFGGRIVFMSTCSVYGAADQLLDEESATSPLSLYASTKLEAERCLLDKNAIVFRLGTLYGVSDLFSRLRFDLVVNTLTLRAHLDGRMTIFGGDQFRPLLHVRDAGHAAAAACGHEAKGVFNLSAQNVRIMDLAYQVRNHFPHAQLELVETLTEDQRNYQVSAAKAIREFGFAPTATIDDGISEIKALLASGAIRNPTDARYHNERFLRRPEVAP